MTIPASSAFDSWFRARHPEIRLQGAHAVLELATGGATVPFIARYRKERTGNLDEVAIRRTLEARELWDRVTNRQAIILEAVERQKKLTPQLKEQVLTTFDLEALEDLYLPYKQKRKTRAVLAREAGLEPLADWIWNCGHGSEAPLPGQTLELWAFTFRNLEKGIGTAEAATLAARDILVERLSEIPELRARVRRALFEKGWLRASRTDKAKPHSKYETYFAFQEKVGSLRESHSSHRYLAVRRGTAEGELALAVGGPPDDPEFEARLLGAFEAAACTVPDSPGAQVLKEAARSALREHVLPTWATEPRAGRPRCSPAPPWAKPAWPLPWSWSARRGRASTAPPTWLGRSSPASTPRCGVRSRSPGASRTRWRSWSRSSPGASGSGSTSTTSRPPPSSAAWRRSWTPA